MVITATRSTAIDPPVSLPGSYSIFSSARAGTRRNPVRKYGYTELERP